MAEFPTQKQEYFAKEIADTLDIDLPKMKTKESYWKFINNNLTAYRAVKTQYNFCEEDMYGIDESDCLGHIPGDA